MTKKRNGKLEVVCGPMFCHNIGQKLLMHNGTTKEVQELKIGEKLIGPDGKPRNITRVHMGVGEMARIIPSRGGEPFIVTLDHTLSLIDTPQSSKLRGGQIVDVSVREWLTWSKYKKSIFKLFRVGVDEFGSGDTLLANDIEPYFMGIILGDGGITQGINITTVDEEILSEIVNQADKWQLNAVRDKITWRISGKKGTPNPIIAKLRELGLHGCDSSNKFIPLSYKTATRKQRMELLAGLIDTDGCAGTCGVSFEYVSKSFQLANDVAFVARSLGLSVTITKTKKKCQNGFEGEYYRLHIGGDVNIIPTRIKRKQLFNRVVKHKSTLTRFDVELLPEKMEFAGVTVDADNRYLLDDFTVTHNCGKTEELIRRIRRITLANKRVQVFKPSIDKRYGDDSISTHDSFDLEGHTGIKPTVILPNLSNIDLDPTVNVVAFDEAQFFEVGIVKQVLDLTYSGKRVICAGLDLDYLGHPIGWMAELLAYADRVTKLKGVCMVCGYSSSRTFRKPHIGSSATIHVGGLEAYEGRCKRCWGNG